MSRLLVYNSGAHDAFTGLPVYVVDTTALAEDGTLPDPETEFKMHLNELPKTGEFVIIFFASGAPKIPQVNWLRRAHSEVPRELKKRMVKVYVVHANWYTKAIHKALSPIVSPKFSRKIKFISSLSEMGREVDITAIDISPAVYLRDLDSSDSPVLGALPVPKQCNSIFGMPLPEYPTAYWRAALQFLGAVSINERTFFPLSKSTDLMIEMCAVLSHAVRREQRLRLFDYGPFVVLAVLKEYLVSLPEPLINIESIEYPLEFTRKYADGVLSKLNAAQRRHLAELFVFFSRASEIVDYRLIVRSMGPAILGLRNPNKQDYAISVRLLSILFDAGIEPSDIHRDIGIKEVSPSQTPQPTVRSNNNETKRSFSDNLSVSSGTSSSQWTGHSRSVSASTQSTFGDMIEYKIKPSNMPSEVDFAEKRTPRVPNRKAYGKVAEIIRLYDESHY